VMIVIAHLCATGSNAGLADTAHHVYMIFASACLAQQVQHGAAVSGRLVSRCVRRRPPAGCSYSADVCIMSLLPNTCQAACLPTCLSAVVVLLINKNMC
jgi:hypothetical protein